MWMDVVPGTAGAQSSAPGRLPLGPASPIAVCPHDILIEVVYGESDDLIFCRGEPPVSSRAADTHDCLRLQDSLYIQIELVGVAPTVPLRDCRHVCRNKKLGEIPVRDQTVVAEI